MPQSRYLKLAVVTSMCLASSPLGFADAVMDQIGPNDSYTAGQQVYLSQFLQAPYSSFDTAVVDDFRISQPMQLTEVDAAMNARSSDAAATFAEVTSWNVEIYSTAAAAVNSLNGNVASVAVMPAAVTLTPSFSDPNTALVKVPVSLNVNAGKYWLALIPSLDYATYGAELGVSESTYPGVPSNSNAVQANPGGGVGFNGNEDALGVNAAYRVLTATPEPGTFNVLAATALSIALGLWQRRRRQITRCSTR